MWVGDEQFEKLGEVVDRALPDGGEGGIVIESLVEKTQQFTRELGRFRREGNHGRLTAGIVAALRCAVFNGLGGIGNDVVDQMIEQRAQNIMTAPFGFQMRVGVECLLLRGAP